jgi:hypothetical protein
LGIYLHLSGKQGKHGGAAQVEHLGWFGLKTYGGLKGCFLRFVLIATALFNPIQLLKKD